jgi:hypothetical protein
VVAVAEAVMVTLLVPTPTVQPMVAAVVRAAFHLARVAVRVEFFMPHLKT